MSKTPEEMVKEYLKTNKVKILDIQSQNKKDYYLEKFQKENSLEGSLNEGEEDYESCKRKLKHYENKNKELNDLIKQSNHAIKSDNISSINEILKKVLPYYIYKQIKDTSPINFYGNKETEYLLKNMDEKKKIISINIKQMTSRLKDLEEINKKVKILIKKLPEKNKKQKKLKI